MMTNLNLVLACALSLATIPAGPEWQPEQRLGHAGSSLAAARSQDRHPADRAHFDCPPGGCPLPPGDQPTIARRLMACSVRVQVDHRGGSGTVIYSTDKQCWILTNRHVALRPQAQAIVEWSNGARTGARVVHVDRASDLALLVASVQTSVCTAAVASDSPRPGQTVWQCGYPRGRGPRLASGEFTGRQQQDTYGGPSWEFRFASDGGDSGSGIFNERGELVAVLWGGPVAGANGLPGVSYGVALAAVQQMLANQCDWWSRGGQGKPSPAPPSGDASTLWTKVTELAAEVEKLKARPDVDPARVQALEQRLLANRDELARQIQDLASGLRQASSVADLKSLETRIDGLRDWARSEMQAMTGQAAELGRRVEATKGQVDGLDRKLAIVEQTAGGLAPVVGAVSGPAGAVLGGIALAAALWRQRRRRRANEGSAPPASGQTQGQTELLTLLIDLLRRERPS